jgi:hypothetical protein
MTDKKDESNVTSFADAKLSKQAADVQGECAGVDAALKALANYGSPFEILASGYPKAGTSMKAMLDGIATTTLMIDIPLAEQCARHGNLIDAVDLAQKDSLAVTFTKAVELSKHMPKPLQIAPEFQAELASIATAIDNAVATALENGSGNIPRFAYGKLTSLHAELCTVFESLTISPEQAAAVAEIEASGKDGNVPN